MRIVVNCRSILLSNRTGIGRYTYNLLDQLGQIDTKNYYILFAQKRMFDFKRKLPKFPYRNFNNALRIFDGPVTRGNIYHLPCPADIGKFDGKVIVTIHDLIYKTFPQSHTQETIDMTEKFMQGIIRRADSIICTSENTRNDLHRFFNFPKERTRAVLNGVEHQTFYPIEDKSTIEPFLKSKGIEGKFLLFVGTLEPRKNLLGLLEAMASLKNNTLPLVVVGMKGWKTEDIAAKVEQLGLSKRVIFTGFVSDAELNMLYNACSVFVFPSYYEGFGFPIVEALSAGATVVCSSNSSCGEIAADAAILIEPSDSKAIATGIQRALEDQALRDTLRVKGFARAQQFSFKQTALETLQIYAKYSNH